MPTWKGKKIEKLVARLKLSCEAKKSESELRKKAEEIFLAQTKEKNKKRREIKKEKKKEWERKKWKKMKEI
uniref:Troponin I n=1 Tax=Strongyloides papillosus TaxID=174720 RepID=A0A0N5BM57_STREA